MQRGAVIGDKEIIDDKIKFVNTLISLENFNPSKARKWLM